MDASCHAQTPQAPGDDSLRVEEYAPDADAGPVPANPGDCESEDQLTLADLERFGERIRLAVRTLACDLPRSADAEEPSECTAITRYIHSRLP